MIYPLSNSFLSIILWDTGRKKEKFKNYKKEYKNRWTEKDINIIKNALLNNLHTGQIVKLLPHKSYKAVSCKISRIRQEQQIARET